MLRLHRLALATLCGLALLPARSFASGDFYVFVSNERSGDLTVIDGATHRVTATIPVGKRPRGIHASSDGKTVYVALSGSPLEGPPQLDAQGNPILKRNQADDDDEAKADKKADGIGIVDVARRTLTGKLNAGSDPEEFALSRDGSRIYVSNEDIKAVSVIDIAANRVEHIVPIGQEPEGVTTSPDGKSFYVTCETAGDVYVIDASSYRVASRFTVAVRPRSVDFLPDGTVAFVPSESKAQLNVIDTAGPMLRKVIDLPAGSRPMRVRVSSDGQRVYVSNGRAGTVSIVDAHSYAITGNVKVGGRPWGIGLSPDGKFLYSANGTSNDVSVVDLAKGIEVARIKAGEGPWGIAIVPR